MIPVITRPVPTAAPCFDFNHVTRWEIPEGTDLSRFTLIKGFGLSTGLFDRLYRGDWKITLPLLDSTEGFLLEDCYLPGMGGKFDTLEAAITWADTVDALDCQHLIKPNGPMPVYQEF